MSAAPAPVRWRRGFVGAAALALAIVCSAACGPDIPANPTWKDDVWPIVRARCIHCHYAMDPAAPESDAANFDYPDFASASAAGAVDALAGAGVIDVRLGRMPKPPATPLADWQVETLSRWAKNPR